MRTSSSVGLPEPIKPRTATPSPRWRLNGDAASGCGATAPRFATLNGSAPRHPSSSLAARASTRRRRRTHRAFEGCEVVAHCAGINREIGGQTYQRVHIDSNANVLEAAKRAGVRKVIMLSFLRARPDCGYSYNESKRAAEELIRDSGLDYTILRAA